MEHKFGKTLRELRIESNMTQRQLASIINVSHVTIGDWEARGHEPSFQTLVDLAKFFKITVGQLLGVEEY